MYAKIESERASKGQGGNKYLNIDILVGSVKEQIEGGMVQVRIDENDKNIFYIDYLYENTTKTINTINLKGKSQKGEKCNEVHDLLDIGCELEH